MTESNRAHPWMANSAPGALQAMLDEIGAPSVEAVFEQIPQDHFRTKPLDLPPPNWVRKPNREICWLSLTPNSGI